MAKNYQPVALPIEMLQAAFAKRLKLNADLASYTTAQTGGTADALIIIQSAAELEQAAQHLWQLNLPFIVLGVGSNVLVNDSGLREIVLLNRARAIQFDPGNPAENLAPSVWAESGALIGTIARQAALRGLSGFEWAGSVPGTLGGAVYGNAGAHGSDMAGSLLLAEILHPGQKEFWQADQLEYTYRSSKLKRGFTGRTERTPFVILSAQIRLTAGDASNIQATMDAFAARRRSTQPPGASMGSMFKNPPGDYAGRLIEAAGLKGTRIGDAEISNIHANFFINHGQACAADIGRLIRLAQETVAEKTGIQLALEIELLGNWDDIFKDKTIGTANLL